MFLPLANSVEERVIKGDAQGTTYAISYFYESNFTSEKDSLVSKKEIDSIFNVIDLSLSTYRSNSLITAFNSHGKILMDTHMKKVVEKSLSISHLSEGAFDITIKPLVDYWKSVRSKRIDTKLIHRIKERVSFRYLKPYGDSLISIRKGIQIDCNGIAQGYTVDVLYNFLISKGIENFLIELGGEIRCSGIKSDGSNWKIGIETPSQNNYLLFSNKIIQCKEKAITTAGNYRKFIESGRKMYAHIIDPQSALPVNNGVISVTVIANDAITADGWDDVFFVKGLLWTQSWLDKNNFLEVLILYEDPIVGIKEFTSKNFYQYTLPIK